GDDVGPGIWLRHRERANLLARDEPGQILALLLGRAVAVDLVHAQVGMRAVRQADGGRAARNLLHRNAMREIAEPCPAVLLIDGDPEHAQLAELRPEIARKLVLAANLTAGGG